MDFSVYESQSATLKVKYRLHGISQVWELGMRAGDSPCSVPLYLTHSSALIILTLNIAGSTQEAEHSFLQATQTCLSSWLPVFSLTTLDGAKEPPYYRKKEHPEITQKDVACSYKRKLGILGDLQIA